MLDRKNTVSQLPTALASRQQIHSTTHATSSSFRPPPAAHGELIIHVLVQPEGCWHVIRRVPRRMLNGHPIRLRPPGACTWFNMCVPGFLAGAQQGRRERLIRNVGFFEGTPGSFPHSLLLAPASLTCLSPPPPLPAIRVRTSTRPRAPGPLNCSFRRSDSVGVRLWPLVLTLPTCGPGKK